MNRLSDGLYCTIIGAVVLTVIVVILVNSCRADVDIPMECRVHNGTGSQCVWSSLETLARYWEIPELYDLTERYGGTAGPQNACSVLHRRSVPHATHHPGQPGRMEFIQACVDYGYGCAIGIGNHMCVLVGLDKESARIISNNNRTKEIQTVPRQEFDRIFDGWAVCIWRWEDE
jgi:hypothetical protein